MRNVLLQQYIDSASVHLVGAIACVGGQRSACGAAGMSAPSIVVIGTPSRGDSRCYVEGSLFACGGSTEEILLSCSSQ